MATSLAGVIGAAAIIAVPVSISAAAPPAAFVAATPAPSSSLPNDGDYNNEGYWETWLEGQGFEDVECVKYEPVEDPFIVPELTDEDRFYVLAVVKGGSGAGANELYWYPEAGDELSHQSAGNSHVILCTAEEEEETSTPTPTVTTTTPTPTVTTTTPTPTVTTTTPTPTVTTTTPTPTVTTTTPTSTTTTPVSTHTTPVPTNTGPGVETDRPATGSSAGLLGAAALVAAGIAAMLFARRRQGDHR